MKEFDINDYNDFERIVNNFRNGRMPFIGESYWDIYRGVVNSPKKSTV